MSNLRARLIKHTKQVISDGFAEVWSLDAQAEKIIDHALAEARAAEIERCAQRAEDEEEPAIGQMPPTIIERVLAGDTAYVESALIAAVRSTKKCIAAAIRNLRDPAADQ